MRDPKLPALDQALDDEVMGRRLAGFFPEGEGEKQATPKIRHEVLKAKPGKHWVIQYSCVSTGPVPKSQTVIGKLYRDNRGEELYHRLVHLSAAASGTSPNGTRFGMPTPLAYLPELGMVVQTVVPGRPLAAFSPTDDWPGAVRAVAKNLAALHSLSLPEGETRGMQEHLKKFCRPRPQVLMAEGGDLAPLVQGILSRLDADQALQAGPVCPVHGDLGLAQIYLDGERAWFIDLDGLCLSHAALDLGNFLVSLTVRLPALAARLRQVFLDTYAEARSSEGLTGLAVYQALMYLRRATICFRLKSGGWRERARELLEAGLAASS